jgi:hypothetical protein
MKVYIIFGIALCLGIIFFSINEVRNEETQIVDNGWMY